MQKSNEYERSPGLTSEGKMQFPSDIRSKTESENNLANSYYSYDFDDEDFETKTHNLEQFKVNAISRNNIENQYLPNKGKNSIGNNDSKQSFNFKVKGFKFSYLKYF